MTMSLIDELRWWISDKCKRNFCRDAKDYWA